MENSEIETGLDSSLESTDTAISPASLGHGPSNSGDPSVHAARRRLILILLAISIVILIVAGGLSFALKHKTASSSKTVIINTQSLDNGTLNKLTSGLDKNGQVNQQLTITPNTLFKSDVTVQGSTSVQNNLSAGGNLSVKGTSNLQGGVVTGGSLAVKGPLIVGSNTSISGNLSVSGQISAASINVGSITLSTINVSGNLSWSGHLMPSGATPTVRPSVAAIGGNIVISGNDNAGTITITAGSGNPTAGEIAIINFRAAYPLTPKIQLTPANTGAAVMQYFVTQSPTFFTLNTVTATAKNTVYTFNYFVTQ